MGVKPKENPPSPAFIETVEEIMKIYKSLPPRPSIEEVEAAMSVLKTVDTEEEQRLEEISKQVVPKDVPEELFTVLQQVRRTMVLFQSHEQRREASEVVEFDKMFQTFDGLIQRTSALVSGDTQEENHVAFGYPVGEIVSEPGISDDSLVGMKKKKKKEDEELKIDGFKGLVKGSSTISSGESEKLSLMKVAAIIENTAKSGELVLDLRGKLVDQVEWLPVSLGKLSDVTELDLSENRIMAIPPTISGLKALTKLDLHSNQLINLPDSFGELSNLTDLDLHANRFKSLPASFGNLINLMNLDLSSNSFTRLPDVIGKLISLKTLTAETNDLEELPFTIGSCTSLAELHLNFNQLRALPEAIGKLVNLEILTVHYNRIKGLPTTIGNLSSLKELDVSFNELESIPENLCFAVRLEKLNVSNNFADLTALPRSIGNLEMLEELDISDDQIRHLPLSFRFLSKLKVFRADETPLEVPPRHVIQLGPQAVVKYMEDYVAKMDAAFQPLKKKKKGFWFWFCSKLCSTKN
ncbi:putative leucine-rich repeat domain, L domain-containing protein [Rosa chinensis]|uniref:Putative leucine-rich repeat domain, L domain-containing protein n=1 Tax=Rosa chinensis TaxID=74649 RepID=A0A2P6P9X3_ROSCH|nr:plant intracellular Ras-group-related LRR protein 5 [Rosa chinensis]PRQ18725.1 putative leucine-rich repeat domain, L domain-containing protein [Rosa chinensis]